MKMALLLMVLPLMLLLLLPLLLVLPAVLEVLLASPPGNRRAGLGGLGLALVPF
jgi:hypothetical protein